MAEAARSVAQTWTPEEGQEFADAVRAHLDRLYGYCVRLASSPTDAEDLLQETLLRAMRAFAGLRDRDRVKGWLFAIATNCWRTSRERAGGRS